MGSRSPYKECEDLGLGMDLWSIFIHLFLSILSLFLLDACLLHFSYWLYTDYIGNTKDLILSLRSFEIHPKSAQKWFTSEFVPSQNHMLILCYSTHIGILSRSAPIVILFHLAPIAIIFFLASILYSAPEVHLALVGFLTQHIL